MEHELITTETAARIAGISSSHVSRLYRSGSFPAPVWFGNRFRLYRRAEVMAWADWHSQQCAPDPAEEEDDV
ncbi:helix-turn-helix domain-containing protein [Xanthomonas axonopodis]|uniref:helix-turn-helix transcriptional regulator n=1 Tax=Xanthomonas axonopodis TaxID=53413 RepID=UPI001591ADFE